MILNFNRQEKKFVQNDGGNGEVAGNQAEERRHLQGGRQMRLTFNLATNVG